MTRQLLNRNPHRRLGAGKQDSDEIKSHPFFNGIDWSLVYTRKLRPPVPQIRKI